ncbi:phosphotransferase [Paenibacillus polygoni]|uniref:Phosphotransferase n=1 Tax=Paenibacillus polygoni TaxID=3050112 RepID=A0ABY8XC39_9BACL|nr:phosphotransferase [Paenibacillus polygoni]WIV21101.1 phosphotransferase [Paenibacillus polygoni]
MNNRGKQTQTYFPVSYSTLSDTALRKFIGMTYGLNDITEFRYLLRGMNDTYLMKTTKVNYVFRVYRADRRSEYSEVAFEIELLTYLDGKGIPVSLPIADQSGNFIQTLNALEGNRFGVLFSFVEGTERSIDDEEISHLFGKSVADIHTKTDGFQSEFTRQPLDLAYLIHQSFVSIEPYMNHRSVDFEWLRTFAKQLEERLLEFPLEELDWGICHGDLHGNTNVSFKEDMSYTHYDFDLCGFGWRAYDIAEFRLAREVRLRHDPDKLERLWNAFIEGYQSVRSLSEKDLQAVPMFVGIRQLWLMGLCLGDSHIHGSIDFDDDFISEKLDFFKNLQV